MARSARVRVDAIEPRPDGHVQVRLIKVIVEDDGVTETPVFEENTSYHRFNLPPGVLTSEARPFIDVYLQELGYPAMSSAEYDMVEAVRAANVNQQKIDAYNTSRSESPDEIVEREKQRERDEVGRQITERISAEAGAVR